MKTTNEELINVYLANRDYTDEQKEDIREFIKHLSWLSSCENNMFCRWQTTDIRDKSTIIHHHKYNAGVICKNPYEVPYVLMYLRTIGYNVCNTHSPWNVVMFSEDK